MGCCKKYHDWFLDVYLSYFSEIKVFFDTSDDFYSYVPEKEIHMPKKILDSYFKDITEWDLFAYLHEIGHIETNTTKMKRYYQEYLATEWAIKKSKEIGFKPSHRILNIYQDYIWKWRDFSERRSKTLVMSAVSLAINY